MPTAEVNGITINYTDTGGDGTPVLFVHAFPLHSGQWDGQVEVFGDRYRLITPDLRGFGSSSAPEDRSAYSMDSFADDLKGLLDELGVERVILAGLSMGGYIAFAFLRKYRSAVAGLVLADTRAEADPPAGIEKRTNQQNQVESEGTDGLIEGLTGALLSDHTKSTKPDVVERVKSLMQNPAAGFIGALEAMKQRPDSTGELASIDVPTLVVVGEDDAVTPPDAAETITNAVADSKLITIPGAGHLSNLEDEQTFNEALAEFLGGVGA